MKSLPFHSLILTTCLLLFGNLNIPLTSSKNTASSEADKESFASFLSHFQHVQLPYGKDFTDFDTYEHFKNDYVSVSTIYQQKRQTKPTALRRTTYIPEIARGKFGRMGPPLVEPIARYYPDDHSITIIYQSTPRFGDDFTSFYQMIRYSLEGKILPFKQDGYDQNSLVIGQTQKNEAITFRIDPKGNIWQDKYELSWYEQGKNKDYRLKLKSQKLVESKLLQINDQGTVTVKPQQLSKDRV